MNKQELFDTAVKGVYEQGCRSLDAEGACAYRGEHGRKCAVGHLIPDDKYDPGMETVSLGGVLSAIGLEDHFLLLDDLQRVHDMIGTNLTTEEFRILWLYNADSLARKHNLKEWRPK